MDKTPNKHNFNNPLKKYIKKDDKADALAVGAIVIIAVISVCTFLALM